MGSPLHTLKLAISSLQKSFTRQIQTFYLSKFQLDLLLRNISKMLQHTALKARVPSFTTEKLHRFKFYQNWCRATSICAEQPQSVRGNLNLCRATSICAKQPQSVQNNLNSCKTTSIRAEKKNPKSNGLFQRYKMNFRTQAFFYGQGTYRNQTFCKKFGREMSRTASAMAETICPPHIEGRHPMLYFNIQRTEKYCIAMCQQCCSADRKQKLHKTTAVSPPFNMDTVLTVVGEKMEESKAQSCDHTTPSLCFQRAAAQHFTCC